MKSFLILFIERYHEPMNCELCLQETGSTAPRNIAGVKVCRACSTSDFLPTRLTGRGMHMGIWCRTADGTVIADLLEMELAKDYTIPSLGESPHPSGIHARLQFEGFGAKMAKIFEHEIQIGDKAFDAMTWIRTNTKDETRAFLSMSKVQAVIAELIAMKCEIDIDNAKLYVKAESNKALAPREFILHVAVLLHLLTEFSTP